MCLLELFPEELKDEDGFIKRKKTKEPHDIPVESYAFFHKVCFSGWESWVKNILC